MLLLLAMFSFYGAFLVMTGPSRGFYGNALGLIVLGLLALRAATRGVVTPRPDRPRIARGPIFDADDPEIAALPPTSTTALSERLRLARERQKRAED